MPSVIIHGSNKRNRPRLGRKDAVQRFEIRFGDVGQVNWPITCGMDRLRPVTMKVHKQDFVHDVFRIFDLDDNVQPSRSATCREFLTKNKTIPRDRMCDMEMIDAGRWDCAEEINS
jgi:hypothetical protein